MARRGRGNRSAPSAVRIDHVADSHVTTTLDPTIATRAKTDTRSRSTTDDRSNLPRPAISTETHFYLPQAEGSRALIVRRRPAAFNPANDSRHAVETPGDEGPTAEIRAQRTRRSPAQLRIARHGFAITSRTASSTPGSTPGTRTPPAITSRTASSTPAITPGTQSQFPVHSRTASSTPAITPGTQSQLPVPHSRNAESTPGSAPALRSPCVSLRLHRPESSWEAIERVGNGA